MKDNLQNKAQFINKTSSGINQETSLDFLTFKIENFYKYLSSQNLQLFRQLYLKMQSKNKDQIKGTNKINYKQKNLDYIEKLKEKKQKEEQDKIHKEKKQLVRRESLKKKILQEASKNRQNKLRQLTDIDNVDNPPEHKTKSNRNINNFQSLPKQNQSVSRIPQSQQKAQQVASQKRIQKNYQQKYLNFLQNLHQNNRSKKEIQQIQKKKKIEKYQKIKQQLGFDKVQSKVTSLLQKKPRQLIRSQSAEKYKTAAEQAQSQMPKTNKNFKKKNDQYIQKIKYKRQQEQQKKQQDIKKKQKLKQNLKEFVMTTVKKNVLDGTYDDELQKLQRKKTKNMKKQMKEDDQDQQENVEEASQEEEEQTNKKKKRKMRDFQHVTDLTQWKKKNRLTQNQKVFIVTGGYPDLKRALRQRGWVQNPNCHSPCFDLKFTLQGRQIQYANLLDFQMANHFQKNGVITTKIGLTKSLRNLLWINDTSQDNFYPKCFDLNDQDDKAGFQTHFKLCKALSILKIYADSVVTRKTDKSAKGLIQDLKLRTQVALSVCRKNIQDLNEVIDKKKVQKIVTDKQWEILAQDQLNQQSLAKKKHQEWLKSIDCKYNGTTNSAKKQQKKPKKKKQKEQIQGEKAQTNNTGQNLQQEQEEDELLDQVKQVLSTYQQKYPQYHITGHNNIWILKPAGLSRGRGITCYNNLIEIQDHMKTKQSQWIAQKYIENPLIIQKRKFDIRQWVIVTDFNPLTIWFYDESYIRFSAADYDAKEVSNKFVHLCNNSIGAYSKDFAKSHIKGNMYFMDECRQYLKNIQGYDVFEQKIKPQLKQIIKQSLMCAAYGVQNRKNSHEMFGYDFMVDIDYKVWLIQVNSSPSMDYSTHVTTKLVKQVLQDTVKLIVDYPAAPKKQRKLVDTGKFKKIYKGIQIPDKMVNTAGLNLCLQGVPLRKGKKSNTVKVQNFSLQHSSKTTK